MAQYIDYSRTRETELTLIDSNVLVVNLSLRSIFNFYSIYSKID